MAKLKCHQKNLPTPNFSLLNFCLGQAEDKLDTAFATQELPRWRKEIEQFLHARLRFALREEKREPMLVGRGIDS